MQTIQPIGDAVFYPSDPDSTARKVASLIESTGEENRLGSLPSAILTPHASYDAAGTIMAAAYRQAGNLHPARVVVLAPLHAEILKSDSEAGLEIFCPEAGNFSCAGNSIPIDTAGTASVTGDLPFAAFRTGYFNEEPAIELQLPFIHHLFPGVPVLPVLAGNRSAGGSRRVGLMIDKLADEQTLFVVTSNLTGHLPVSEAESHAEQAISLLEQRAQSPAFFAPGQKNRVSMCGSHILAAFIKSSRFELWDIITRGISPEIPGSERRTHFAAGVLPGAAQ